MWRAFWAWYEHTYTLNISIALGLFLLQIAHLVWLFGEVVWAKTFGTPLFEFSELHQLFIVLVDYTEIPALVSVSLIYINELRGKLHFKNALYLAFLNIQWLHLFWITDEFVIAAFTGSASVAFPLWLAWVAISIDYLEVPVMFDILMKFIAAIKEKRLGTFFKHQLREGQ